MNAKDHLWAVAARLLILAFLFAMYGCGGGDDDPTSSSADKSQTGTSDAGTGDSGTSGSDEEVVTPYLELSQEECEVPADGGTFDVTVTTNVDYTVTIPCDWITQTSSTSSSSTKTVITFTVSANETTEARTAKITLSGGNITLEVTVTQEGGYLEVSQTEVDVAAGGEAFTLDISANVSYTVDISEDWLIQDETGAFVAEETDTTEERTAVITISWGETAYDVTVTQAGGYLQVSPTEVNLQEGSETFEVTVQSNVTFDTSISNEWLTLSGTETDSDTTVLVFSAEANDVTEERTASIVITWSQVTCTVTVTQEKAFDTEGGAIDDMKKNEW